jgi:hypothetical protein
MNDQLAQAVHRTHGWFYFGAGNQGFGIQFLLMQG